MSPHPLHLMHPVRSKVPGCRTGKRIFAVLACGYCGSGVRARTAIQSIVSVCCDERSVCPIDLNSPSFSCPAIPIPNTAICLHGLVVGIWRRSLVPYEFPDGSVVHPEPARGAKIRKPTYIYEHFASERDLRLTASTYKTVSWFHWNPYLWNALVGSKGSLYWISLPPVPLTKILVCRT